MSRAPSTRLLVAVGLAAGLLILPVVRPGPAQACVISVRPAVAVSTIFDGCAVGLAEEDGASDRDQTVLSDDDPAPSNLSGLVLSSPSENRSQVVAVNNIGGRRGPSAVSSVGADALDMAASDAADDPGPRGVPAQRAGADRRLARAGPNTEANDHAAPLDDALWQAAKYLVRHYDIISPDGDVAAIIRLGMEAVHSIDHYSTISLDDNAAATGLGPPNRYQSISLDGDAVDTGLHTSQVRRADVGEPFHEVGTFAYCLTAVHNFLFSRNGLIAALIVMVAYIAVVGLQSLIRSSR